MTERLDASELLRLLDYTPATGDFRWRESSRGRSAGALAGGKNDRGYRYIRIHGRLYSAHRLAWLYQHGCWPKADIDHINRDKGDNRIANLRDVPRSVNNRNRATAKNSKSGVTGVSMDSRSGKWTATVRLGSFDTIEEAQKQYEWAISTLGLDF